MSENQINTFVHIVDYLAVSAAMTPNFGPVVMITVRHDLGNCRPHVDETDTRAKPGDFRPHNLALTKDQARRLRDELNQLFDLIPCFHDEQEEAEGQPKPRRRRRGRKKKG